MHRIISPTSVSGSPHVTVGKTLASVMWMMETRLLTGTVEQTDDKLNIQTDFNSAEQFAQTPAPTDYLSF